MSDTFHSVNSIHPTIINASELLMQLIDEYGDDATILAHTFNKVKHYQDDLINIIDNHIIKYEPEFLEICSFLMIYDFFSIITDDTRRHGKVENANMVLASKCSFSQIWYDSIFNATGHIIYLRGIFFKDPTAELHLWSEHGHIDCITWARASHDIPWSTKTSKVAALNGRIECLEYLHTNGCPWNEDACSSAAEYGQLDCLEYAHSNGCPWNEMTCSLAAWNGYLECLEYAHSNGCPWNSDVCRYSALNGNIDCLKYAHSNGCPWDEMTYTYAHPMDIHSTLNGHIECLKYLSSNRCPE